MKWIFFFFRIERPIIVEKKKAENESEIFFIKYVFEEYYEL